MYLQDARHGAALICRALEDAVGSAGATALAKARRKRRQRTMAIPFMATDFQPISSGYYHHKTYQYILNISNIMPLGFPLGHESPDVSRLNLDPDGQTQGLWECKAGPEDLVNFGKTNKFMPGKWECNRQQQVYGTR